MRKSERRSIGGGGLGISSTWGEKRASASVVFDEGDGAYGKAGVAVGGVRRRRSGLGFWVLDLRQGLGHDGPELKQ